MTILLLVSITISSLQPLDSLQLPYACTTIEIYNNQLFGAPFTGNTVYRVSLNGSWRIITFTDNPPVRIIDLAVTPFALFINTGTEIIRYFLSNMDHTNMIQSDHISSFAITPSEELIYADERMRTVHFLDYTRHEKNRLEELIVRDMIVVDTFIYILTNSHVAVYDEFGNTRMKSTLKGSFNGIHVQDDRVYLFSQGQQRLSVITDDGIRTYDLPFMIQDITGSDSLIYVLDKRGTVVYRYNCTAF